MSPPLPVPWLSSVPNLCVLAPQSAGVTPTTWVASALGRPHSGAWWVLLVSSVALVTGSSLTLNTCDDEAVWIALESLLSGPSGWSLIGQAVPPLSPEARRDPSSRLQTRRMASPGTRYFCLQSDLTLWAELETARCFQVWLQNSRRYLGAAMCPGSCVPTGKQALLVLHCATGWPWGPCELKVVLRPRSSS